MSNELKESNIKMPYQIRNINNTGMMKKNQIEILELKLSIAKMKSTLEVINSDTCMM